MNELNLEQLKNIKINNEALLVLIFIFILFIYIAIRIQLDGCKSAGLVHLGLLLGYGVLLYYLVFKNAPLSQNESSTDSENKEQFGPLHPFNNPESGTQTLSDLRVRSNELEKVDLDLYDEDDMPQELQDIYLFENQIADQKMRNKDAYPHQTSHRGPRLGPNWQFSNDDVVEHITGNSRAGTYDLDPTIYAGPYHQYTGTNDEAYDADDGLASRQSYLGYADKRAKDGANRTTRNIFNKFFAEELNAESSKEWWGNSETMSTDFLPY